MAKTSLPTGEREFKLLQGYQWIYTQSRSPQGSVSLNFYIFTYH